MTQAHQSPNSLNLPEVLPETMIVNRDEVMPVLLGLKAKASEYYRLAESYRSIALKSDNPEFVESMAQNAQGWMNKAESYDSLHNDLFMRYAHQSIEATR